MVLKALCSPGQEIFKFGEVKNDMFLPTGQVDLNFFLPCFNHIQVLTDTYLLTYGSINLHCFQHSFIFLSLQLTIFT